jgi:peptidoglycan/xylan/chitin deacetylase (PgdA/CDA1 family)
MIETLNGTIPVREMMLRSSMVFQNQWQRIGEVMEFDRKQGIPSTFFVGVNNGKMLAYSLKNAAYWIRRIHENGFDVGVHGIDYTTLEGVQKEFETFRQILPGIPFGIRMHYLRHNEDTLGFMDAAGYRFDTSVREQKRPYKTGNLWEFPLHIMDGDMIYQGKRYASKSFAQVQDFTRREIEEVHQKNIPYLTLLFHDRYFHPGFSLWKAWYEWVISWCSENGFTFTSYSSAIHDLESGFSN